MPVSRIAARSARGFVYLARFGNTPGYSTGSRPASSGLVTFAAYLLSPDGASEFHSSFSAIGLRTSLTSGLPRRETWTFGPTAVNVPSPLATLLLGSSAEAHTPMVACASMTPDGFLPPKVRSVTGTCSAIECTLRPCRPLMPMAAADGIKWWDSNGRSAPRSKMLPRSTWNASPR